MSASERGLTAVGTPYDPRAARGAIIVLAAMALMVTYVETMVLPAFKAFVLFFDNAPTTTVVWIVSAYLLVGTVATPIFGKLGDKYGKKRMLIFVMTLYAVVVSVAGFTPNIGTALGVSTANQIYILIGVRAFQGLGMGMFPLAFAMLPEVYPASRVGQAQGIIGGMFATGAALGLVGGGYIAYTFGWQLTYHTVTPIAIVVVILAYFYLRESPHLSPKPIDIPGISSLGFALAMVMFGLTEGVYWGWTSFSAVSLAGIPFGVPDFFLLALAATAFFLYWEPRAPTPVVSFKALKERNIWISNVNGVIVGLGMFLIFVALTILVEDPYSPGFGYDEFQMGLVALPSALGMLIFAPLWGRWVARRGPKPVIDHRLRGDGSRRPRAGPVPFHDRRTDPLRHPRARRERRGAHRDVEHHRALRLPEGARDSDRNESDVPEPRERGRARARRGRDRQLRYHRHRRSNAVRPGDGERPRGHGIRRPLRDRCGRSPGRAPPLARPSELPVPRGRDSLRSLGRAAGRDAPRGTGARRERRPLVVDADARAPPRAPTSNRSWNRRPCTRSTCPSGP